MLLYIQLIDFCFFVPFQPCRSHHSGQISSQAENRYFRFMVPNPTEKTQIPPRWRRKGDKNVGACMRVLINIHVYCILTHTRTPHLVLSIALLHTHTHHTSFGLLHSSTYYTCTHTPNLLPFIAFLYTHTHTHTHTHTQSHSCTPYPFSRKQKCPSWTLKQRNTNWILFQLCIHCAICYKTPFFSRHEKWILLFCVTEELIIKSLKQLPT